MGKTVPILKRQINLKVMIEDDIADLNSLTQKLGLDILSIKILDAIDKTLRQEFYFQKETKLGMIIVAYNLSKTWINIYCDYSNPHRSLKDTQCYGYSIKEQRWAFECEPKNSKEIEHIIDQMKFAIYSEVVS